jgi:hypothetical protein
MTLLMRSRPQSNIFSSPLVTVQEAEGSSSSSDSSSRQAGRQQRGYEIELK